MLRQDFPRPYGVWLADEDPDEETRRWCAARGVRVSSRKGVAGYHNPTWPRRARSKEGNLAFFYDRYGYDGYDLVAQLDANLVVPIPVCEEESACDQEMAKFLHEMGVQQRPEPQAKLTVTVSSVPQELTLVLLESKGKV
jgi:cellulose synthase/poly-beta-1,6-N-acetylglucosamine synthase-like glycosyltransferase